jgi:hypothetical protein
MCKVGITDNSVSGEYGGYTDSSGKGGEGRYRKERKREENYHGKKGK